LRIQHLLHPFACVCACSGRDSYCRCHRGVRVSVCACVGTRHGCARTHFVSVSCAHLVFTTVPLPLPTSNSFPRQRLLRWASSMPWRACTPALAPPGTSLVTRTSECVWCTGLCVCVYVCVCARRAVASCTVLDTVFVHALGYSCLRLHVSRSCTLSQVRCRPAHSVRQSWQRLGGGDTVRGGPDQPHPMALVGLGHRCERMSLMQTVAMRDFTEVAPS
jgi:hypothetical protein